MSSLKKFMLNSVDDNKVILKPITLDPNSFIQLCDDYSEIEERTIALESLFPIFVGLEQFIEEDKELKNWETFNILINRVGLEIRENDYSQEGVKEFLKSFWDKIIKISKSIFKAIVAFFNKSANATKKEAESLTDLLKLLESMSSKGAVKKGDDNSFLYDLTKLTCDNEPTYDIDAFLNNTIIGIINNTNTGSDALVEVFPTYDSDETDIDKITEIENNVKKLFLNETKPMGVFLSGVDKEIPKSVNFKFKNAKKIIKGCPMMMNKCLYKIIYEDENWIKNRIIMEDTVDYDEDKLMIKIPIETIKTLVGITKSIIGSIKQLDKNEVAILKLAKIINDDSELLSNKIQVDLDANKMSKEKEQLYKTMVRAIQNRGIHPGISLVKHAHVSVRGYITYVNAILKYYRGS